MATEQLKLINAKRGISYYDRPYYAIDFGPGNNPTEPARQNIIGDLTSWDNTTISLSNERPSSTFNETFMWMKNDKPTNLAGDRNEPLNSNSFSFTKTGTTGATFCMGYSWHTQISNSTSHNWQRGVIGVNMEYVMWGQAGMKPLRVRKMGLIYKKSNISGLRCTPLISNYSVENSSGLEVNGDRPWDDNPSTNRQTTGRFQIYGTDANTQAAQEENVVFVGIYLVTENPNSSVSNLNMAINDIKLMYSKGVNDQYMLYSEEENELSTRYVKGNVVMKLATH